MKPGSTVGVIQGHEWPSCLINLQKARKVFCRCSYVNKTPGSDQTPRRTSDVWSEPVLIIPLHVQASIFQMDDVTLDKQGLAKTKTTCIAAGFRAKQTSFTLIAEPNLPFYCRNLIVRYLISKRSSYVQKGRYPMLLWSRKHVKMRKTATCRCNKHNHYH